MVNGATEGAVAAEGETRCAMTEGDRGDGRGRAIMGLTTFYVTLRCRAIVTQFDLGKNEPVIWELARFPRPLEQRRYISASKSLLCSSLFR